MNAWMYQPGVAATPAPMTDDMECARVQVWRQGFGWVDRLCPWHQAVVDGVMSDITEEPGRVRLELTESLSESCKDCA